MKTAHVRLVEGVHYRKVAFESGLEHNGYSIVKSPDPGRGNILVTWNRYARDEPICAAYERAGGTVLVAENAWLGPEEKDQHLFAICKGHHNGAGSWYVGDRPRYWWPVAPWRKDGDYIVVLPQRGMGERGVRQERDWLPGVLNRLSRMTSRPIRVHHHPGPRPHPPIDFRDTWACVTWASGAAIKAIVAGIPVFYEFPKWIGAGAARFLNDNLEEPFLGDRGPMLHRLSWATWSAEDIAKGEPFEWLLQSA